MGTQAGSRSRTCWAITATLIGAGALLVACTGGPTSTPNEPPATTSSSPATTAAPTPSTTAPPTSEQAVVEAAYREAIEAYRDASAVADPWHPALAATHVGLMLERRQQNLIVRQADSEVGQRRPGTRIEIYDIQLDPADPSVARLSFCSVDHDVVVHRDSGAMVNDRVTTVQGRAAMQRVDGSWRLSERVADSQIEGDQPCAAGS